MFVAVAVTVTTSAFAAAEGGPVWPTLRVQPGTVTLQPGAHALVQIAALVDDSLIAGVAYKGEVSVSGLSDTPVAVVLRRLPASAPPAPASSPEPDPPAADAKPRGRATRRARVRR